MSSRKVYSTSVGIPWQSDTKYDSNRRKHNTKTSKKKK